MTYTEQTSHSLQLQGRQLMLQGFPVLAMPDAQQAVKYFSLNPFLPTARNRCPLDCAYCVCHQDRAWHHHPEQFADTDLPDDLLEQLLDYLFATPEGQNGAPISLCDYSDPFIAVHRERVLTLLQALIDRQASSLVYITTKAHPGLAYLTQLKAILARPHALRVTVFVSLPPLKPGYEKVSIADRVRLIQDLVRLGIPCCWYLRPLVEEWFDEELMWQLARSLVPHIQDHIILSGIVMSDDIAAYLEQQELLVPQWDLANAGRKQPLSSEFEAKLRHILHQVAEELDITLGPVMGHRLCGTNGNHAYGCLMCAQQQRYCQLFQLYHYGETITAKDHQRLKQVLQDQQDSRPSFTEQAIP